MYELDSIYGENPTPNKVVILVHGTWGSNALTCPPSLVQG